MLEPTRQRLTSPALGEDLSEDAANDYPDSIW
mgnify:CR=1 FL=1|jgi:hypothetical protein